MKSLTKKSHETINLLSCLLLFTIAFLASVNSYSQNPNWIYGNQLIHFSNSGITTSPLPQPGSNPALHYTGQIPDRGQNCQFDNQGNLLFFIIDGSIYDKEGYVIANGVNYIDNVSSSNQLPMTSGDIAITNVPGYCDKFYVFCAASISQGASLASIGVILDMEAPNPFFPGRKGRIITYDLNTSYYNSTFDYFFQLNLLNSELNAFYNSTYLNLFENSPMQRDNISMEIIEINQNDKLLVLAGRHDGILIYRISLSSFSSIEFCADSDDWGVGYSSGSVQAKVTPQGYLIAAITKLCSTEAVTSNAIVITDINQFGTIQSQSILPVGNSDSESDYVTSVEFSPDGSKIWFTKNNAPFIGVVQISSGTVTFPFQSDLSAFSYSEIETQIDETGNSVLFLNSSLGLYKITDPNSPTLSTLIPQLNMPLANNFTTDGENQILTIQVQNLGLNIQQDFLSGSCCVEFQNNMAYNEMHFTSNATWQNNSNPFQNAPSPIYVSGDLVFEAGANVTISGMEFRFGPNAHVIVKTGAIVNLNNSKWTSYTCDGIMWPGAQVWGHGNLAQLPQSNQGVLNLKNSIIEFAINGVEVGVPSQFSGVIFANYNPDNSGGGILRCTNSTFHNNAKDVLFHKYVHYSNNLLLVNQSLFKGCLFKTDDVIKDTSISYSDQFSLFVVYNKVIIANCSFINYTPTSVYSYGHRRKGIYSICSGIVISGQNNAWSGIANDNVNTTFYGLDYGIHVGGLNGLTSSVSCTNMEFQRCVTGFQNEYSDNSVIVENNFEIPNVTYSMQSGSFSGLGVGLKQSTGYVFHDNLFLGGNYPMISLPSPHGRGIVVQNSGDLNNYITNNSFNFLKKGIEVQMNNGNMLLKTGLQLLCNQFYNCNTDIQRDANSTMRNSQGGSNQTAGNKFSHAGIGGGYIDFFTNSNNSQPITYEAFDVPLEVPDFFAILSGVGPGLTVTLHSVSSSACNTINSHNSHMPLAGHTLAEIKQRVIDAQNFYSVVIDGSLTTETKDVLKNADSNESLYLKTLLTERFPLSNEVMKEMIVQGEKLNPIHLTEILLQNAPISKDVYRFLDQSNLLSSNLLSIIYNANQGISYSKQLENEIVYAAEDLHSCVDSLYQISSIYIGDSLVGTDFTNYISQISILTEDSYFENAVAMANSINTDLSALLGTLNSSELVEFYTTLNAHLMNFDSLLTSTDSLSASSYILSNILDTASRNFFLGLLFNYYGSSIEMYEEEILPTRSMEIDLPSSVQEKEISFFTASPNPNDGNFNMLLSPQTLTEQCWIQVTNNMGQLITSDHIVQSSIENFALKHLPPGIYFVSLYNKLGLIDSQMIVIEKND